MQGVINSPRIVYRLKVLRTKDFKSAFENKSLLCHIFLGRALRCNVINRDFTAFHVLPREKTNFLGRCNKKNSLPLVFHTCPT